MELGCSPALETQLLSLPSEKKEREQLYYQHQKRFEDRQSYLESQLRANVPGFAWELKHPQLAYFLREPFDHIFNILYHASAVDMHDVQAVVSLLELNLIQRLLSLRKIQLPERKEMGPREVGPHEAGFPELMKWCKRYEEAKQSFAPNKWRQQMQRSEHIPVQGLTSLPLEPSLRLQTEEKTQTQRGDRTRVRVSPEEFVTQTEFPTPLHIRKARHERQAKKKVLFQLGRSLVASLVASLHGDLNTFRKQQHCWTASVGLAHNFFQDIK